ncbi:Vacuolar protease A [Chytriomyces hyalinus]|nr:Vacuolar protease A [Chytriomyces hyalinus]
MFIIVRYAPLLLFCQAQDLTDGIKLPLHKRSAAQRLETRDANAAHSYPLINYKSAAYYAQVLIGTPPQLFSVAADTGSDKLVRVFFGVRQSMSRRRRIENNTPAIPFIAQSQWVPSTYCSSCLGINPFFDAAKSSSFVSNGDTIVPINYVIGNVSGTRAQEYVQWGDLSSKDQQFLLVVFEDPVSSQSFENQGDGIMGLAYQDGLQGSFHSTLMYSIITQNKIEVPIFTIWLNQSSKPISDAALDPLGGQMSIGGVDRTVYTGAFNFLPIERPTATRNSDGSTTNTYYWSLSGNYVLVGNTVVTAPDQTSFILDSGTTFMTMDSDSMNRFIVALSANFKTSIFVYNKGDGFFRVSCTLASSLPDITFNMGTLKNASFTLKASEYVYSVSEKLDQCFLAIQILDHPSIGSRNTFWVFGDVFMKKWYWVFDLANAQVGFAVAADGRTVGDGVPLTVAALEGAAVASKVRSGANAVHWNSVGWYFLFAAALMVMF